MCCKLILNMIIFKMGFTFKTHKLFHGIHTSINTDGVVDGAGLDFARLATYGIDASIKEVNSLKLLR